MRSSTEARLNRMPRFSPTPLPTMMAVGVASPSAHGQAMTSTAIMSWNEKRNRVNPSGRLELSARRTRAQR